MPYIKPPKTTSFLLPPSPLSSPTSTLKQVSLANDKAAPPDATDTISRLRWSPTADRLAASCWDGQVRIYDVATDLTAKGIACIKTDAPILSCDWSKVSFHLSPSLSLSLCIYSPSCPALPCH